MIKQSLFNDDFSLHLSLSLSWDFNLLHRNEVKKKKLFILNGFWFQATGFLQSHINVSLNRLIEDNKNGDYEPNTIKRCLKSIIINFNSKINSAILKIKFFFLALFVEVKIHLFLSFDEAQFIINKKQWLRKRWVVWV